MGVVYKAQQISTNREVALKIVKLDLGDDARIERFQQEIDIISQLSHPNVVRVFDTGTLPGHDLLYVVMEYIDGISLGDVLWHKHAEDQYFKCRTRVEFALEVIYQLCAALTEPHRLEIIHRDIKPENIILAPSSDETIQVKVLDFGIARVLNEKSSTARKKMTDARVPFVGTPHYMAPEQVARSQYDARTDLYAVGVILYEMLTGQYPFDDDNVLALLLRKTQNSPPPLTELIPDDFPYPEVAALTESMLAIDIDRRPADAMQVRRIIEDIRDKYRMRRVRVRAESYLGREETSEQAVATLDDDSRLEPLRALYRKWLLYPSGRPLVAESDERAEPSGLAQLGDLSGFGASPEQKESKSSGTFLPEGEEIENKAAQHTDEISEVDEEEDIESHTDILSSPKRQHLKAWSMDAEFSNSFDVGKLQEGAAKIQEFEGFFEQEDQPKGDVDDAVTSIWKPDLDALPDDLRKSFAGEVEWDATFGSTASDDAVPMSDTREDPAVQGTLADDDDQSIEGVVPPGFAQPNFHHTPDPNASGFGGMFSSDPNSSSFGAEPASGSTENNFGAETASPSFPHLALNQETTQEALGVDDHGLPYDTIPEPLGRDSEIIKKLMAEKDSREQAKSAPSLEDLTGEASVEGLFDEDPTTVDDRPEGLRRPERDQSESIPLALARADELELDNVAQGPNESAKREADQLRERMEQREQEQARNSLRKNLLIGLLLFALLVVAAVAFFATRGG